LDFITTFSNWKLIPQTNTYQFSLTALTWAEECHDEDDCTHVECPEDDYELECVRQSCTCTHGKKALCFLYNNKSVIVNKCIHNCVASCQ